MIGRSRNIEVETTADGLWIAGPAGRARLARLSSTVIRIDVEGHAYAEFADAMQGAIEQAGRAGGRLYIGMDAEGMTSYDSRFRYVWTEWVKANREAIDGLLILYRNHAVQGVAVIINAVTGGELVETCDDRDEFEDRLAAAVTSSQQPATAVVGG